MKKVVLNVVAAALMVLGLGGVATISPAYAATANCADGTPAAKGDITTCPEWSGNNATGIANNSNLMDILNVIINVIVGAVGFVAVVMIILGGLSYVTSQGDSAKTTKARNTILYGVVGLIVALLAFAIVNFVLSNVFK